MILLMPSVSSTVDEFSRLVLGFRYYKLALLGLSILLSYQFFTSWGGAGIVGGFENGGGLAAALVGGVLYAFGFTAPFAIGIFLSLDPGKNVPLLAIAGGFGALLADYFILKLVRTSFKDEFDRLGRTRPFQYASKKFAEYLPEKTRRFLLVGMAGFFIASPLPDEIGVSFLAGFTEIQEREFALVSFALNTAGILLLLLL